EKRRRYDTFGHAGGPQGAEGFDFGGQGGFGDIFNDIFEDFFGQPRGRARAERGNDLQYISHRVSKNRSSAKKPNSKFLVGKPVQTARVPAQNPPPPSRCAHPARDRAKCVSSKASSASAAPAGNAKERDRSSRSPARPAADANGFAKSACSPFK